jgi:glycosyltransferase involved in cell wall biosynthesis
VDVEDALIEVLPCGVDLDEFHPFNVEGIVVKYDLPQCYVIAPGALTAVKGPQNLVCASKEYADLAPTIFIGAGDLRSQLETELGERGRFLGFVPAEDKAQLINAAALLTAAPQKKEHFGIIYAEALAGGTPVVAYEGGGVGSILTPEVGVLTERSPEALGKAIRALLLDKPRRDSMALAARNRAESHFCGRLLAERLEAWLLSLLDQDPAA